MSKHKSKAKSLTDEERNHFLQEFNTYREDYTSFAKENFDIILSQSLPFLTYQSPSILSTIVTLSLVPDRTILSVEFDTEIDYGAFVLLRHASMSRGVTTRESNHKDTEEWVSHEILLVVNQLATQIWKSIPDDVESLVKKAGKANVIFPGDKKWKYDQRQSPSERVDDMKKNIVPALEKAAREKLERVFESKELEANIPCPYLTGKLGDVSVWFDVDSELRARSTLTYTISYFPSQSSLASPAHSISSTVDLGVIDLLPLLAKNRKTPFDNVIKGISSAMDKQMAKHNWPILKYISLGIPEEIVQEAKQIDACTEEDGNVRGTIRGCANPLLPPPSLSPFVCWDKPAAIYRAAAGKKNVALYTDLEWESYQKLKKTPFSKETRHGPSSLHEFTAFIGLAKEVYKKAFSDMPNAQIQIAFLYDKKKEKLISYTLNGETRPINTVEILESTIGKWLYKLLLGIRGEYIRHKQSIAQYKEELKTLNLSKLDILLLEHIYRAGRTWYTQAYESVKDLFPCSKTAVENHLDKLCKLRLHDSEGNEVQIISYSWARNKWHDMFVLYTPTLDLTAFDIAIIPPRPLDVTDVADIEASSRDAWATELCVKAKTKEELWSALQILEGMPKAFLKRFIETEEGKMFFSKLDGGDAMYASLMLDKIPGCKTFAKSLLLSA